MRYIHISQKPYCCVPACMQMVLRRRGLPTPTQSNIGYALGMLLPPAKRDVFDIKSHTGKQPKAGWGTRINKKKYSLQNFFLKNSLPLVEKFYSASNFKSKNQLKSFLKKNIEKDDDLLTCFSYSLYNKESKIGHASLISKIDTKDNVILVDPGRKYKKPRTVSLDDYYIALKKHPDGGIWHITSKN